MDLLSCGIFDHGVTSIVEEIGNIVDQKDVIKSLNHYFADIFGIQIIKKQKSTDLSII
jgi:lipoate-protein ligase B